MRWSWLVLLLFIPLVQAQGVTLFYGVVHGLQENDTLTARIGADVVGEASVVDGQFGYESPMVVRGAEGEEVTFFIGGLAIGTTTMSPDTSRRIDLYTPQAREQLAQENKSQPQAPENVAAQTTPPVQRLVPKSAPIAEPAQPASGTSATSSGSVSMLMGGAVTLLVVVGMVCGLLIYKRRSGPGTAIKGYITKMRAAGYQPQQIYGVLRQQGWSEKDINDAFK